MFQQNILLIRKYETLSLNSSIYIATCISSARQRLVKHVPESYAVNKNRRLLLDNGFSYHGTKHVSGTTHT
jgi:hypothetical protein